MSQLDYQLALPSEGDTVAVMKTSKGDIFIKLFDKDVPTTVENFAGHAKAGYYNNLKFHRVMEDFMVQGGDPRGDGRGGESIWGTPFRDEFSARLFNYRGALSMANAGPNTNGSQFFIVQKKGMDPREVKQLKAIRYPDEAVANYEKLGGTAWLDNRHSVFGQVYKGMDVVDAIAAVETNASDAPLEDVLILSVEITTFKAE